MKGGMKMKRYEIASCFVICSSISLFGCQDENIEQANKQENKIGISAIYGGVDKIQVDGIQLGKLLIVDEWMAKRGGDVFVQDELAAQNFAILNQMFEDGSSKQLSLSFVQLRPTDREDATLQKRIKHFALSASENKELNFKEFRAGNKLLSVNAQSGAERYVDNAQFHRGEGVDFVLEKEFYLSTANKYLDELFLTQKVGKVFPYKFRYYKNAVREEGSHIAQESTYQLALAYNTSIDGLPVIGSGGKIALHLSPKGELLSYESTLRDFDRIALISGSELLSPKAAQAEAEARFKERGVDLSKLVLSRAEFGYLRLGRKSIQNYVAPHYVFIYSPPEGVMDKKRMEVIPAITNPKLLQLLKEDSEKEAARKKIAPEYLKEDIKEER